MRILGIDPGIGRMGWGIVEVVSQKATAKKFGCLETSQQLDVGERLLAIHNFLDQLLVTEKPEAAAVEELFFGTNVTTAFSVGQARGVILFTLAKYQIPVYIYTPPQVKAAVTGYGKAEKNQVGQMVKAILKCKRG